MAILCLPSSSVEYLSASVVGSYTESMPVHMAVVPYGTEPGDDDWHPAEWDDGTARILVGEGSDVGELDEGSYGIWVKVTASIEVPVVYSGPVRIT